MTAVVLMLALGSFLEYSNANNLIMLFINLCVAASFALHASTDPSNFDFLLGVVEIITYAQLIYLAKWLRSGGLLLNFAIVKLATYGCLKMFTIIFIHFKDVDEKKFVDIINWALCGLLSLLALIQFFCCSMEPLDVDLIIYE